MDEDKIRKIVRDEIVNREDKLLEHIEKGFNKIDQRFEQIDQRFEKIEERLDEDFGQIKNTLGKLTEYTLTDKRIIINNKVFKLVDTNLENGTEIDVVYVSGIFKKTMLIMEIKTTLFKKNVEYFIKKQPKKIELLEKNNIKYDKLLFGLVFYNIKKGEKQEIIQLAKRNDIILFKPHKRRQGLYLEQYKTNFTI